MPTPHPDYPGYYIYWEKNKEKPTGGHFYAQDGHTLFPHNEEGGHSLFWHAKYGCGNGKLWWVINRNVWNRKHLVYKKSSTNCSSGLVDSNVALTTSDIASKNGAFIALCQINRSNLEISLGVKYPILYIPAKCDATGIDENPDDKKKVTTTIIAPNLPKIVNIPLYNPTTVVTIDKPNFITPTTPATPTSPEKGPFGPGVVPTGPSQIPTGVVDSKISYPPTYPPADDGGIPWWVWLLLLLAGGTVGVVAYKKSKKKKGKKGKKKRRR